MSLSSRLLLIAALLIHLGMLVSWRTGTLNPLFFDATVTHGRRGWDFYALYQAGHNVLTGHSVYESDGARIEVVIPDGTYTPFRYLPVSAYTLGVLLNGVPPLWGYRLWVAFTELVLWACVWLTWRATPDPNRRARLAAMWLCFSPYYLELYMGQFSFVQGALLFLMLLAARQGAPSLSPHLSLRGAQRRSNPQLASEDARSTPAVQAPPPHLSLRAQRSNPQLASEDARSTPAAQAPPPHLSLRAQQSNPQLASEDPRSASWRGSTFDLAWVASVLWKQNTALLAPLMLRLRRWRALALLAALLVITAGPYFALVPGSLAAFLGNFRSEPPWFQLGNMGLRQLLFDSMWSAGDVLGLQIPGAWYSGVQAAVALIVLAVPLLLTLLDRTPDVTDHIALWMSAYFALYHHVWEHHYVMILPVLVALALRGAPRGVWAIYLLLALPSPFYLIDPHGQVAVLDAMRWTPIRPLWQGLLYHASKSVPVLALYGLLAWRIARRLLRERRVLPAPVAGSVQP